jgi:hydroxymethylbilane synthase
MGRRSASAAPMDRTLTLGTRGSPLALAQARMVADALEKAHGWPAGSVVLKAVRTSGDKIQDRPLAEAGGKALWTKELDLALLSGETDLSVHSMKDVESDRPEFLAIAAMLERADVRDRLIGAGSIERLPHGARVGTSSPRRAAQLLSQRPDLEIVPIRGNVETRLGKVERGEVDSTLLAAAGLDRLGLEAGVAVPVETMLPAAGQAAIGVECRADDAMVRELLAAIDHEPTHAAVESERAFSRALGGTCHSPVGALAVIEDGSVWMRAELLSEDGADRVVDEGRFAAGDVETPAKLAKAMLGRAPGSIRKLFQPK